MTKRKKIILGASVLLFAGIVSAGVAAYLYRDILWGQSESAQVTYENEFGEEKLTETVSAASTLAGLGNLDQATKVIDQSIQQTDVPAEKAELYRTKATMLSGSRPQEAIEAAESAATLDSSYAAYELAGQLHRQLGNTTEAIDYFSRALEAYDQLPPSEEGGPMSREYYVEILEELRG